MKGCVFGSHHQLGLAGFTTVEPRESGRATQAFPGRTRALILKGAFMPVARTPARAPGIREMLGTFSEEVTQKGSTG